MTSAHSSERKLLLVVDAPSLLHRNHHARAHTRITDASGRRKFKGIRDEVSLYHQALDQARAHAPKAFDELGVAGVGILDRKGVGQGWAKGDVEACF